MIIQEESVKYVTDFMTTSPLRKGCAERFVLETERSETVGREEKYLFLNNLLMIKFNGYTIAHFEHMVHHKNLKNILEHGVLSHNTAYQLKLIQEDISMIEIQDRRKSRIIEVKNKEIGIHDFVSFYFNSKNPMLYLRKNIQHELLIILINSSIINTRLTDSKFAIFSDGNAGSNKTKFYSGEENLKNIDLDLIFADSWNDPNEIIKRENRRKRCSEVLVYPMVEVADIKSIICPNDTMNKYAHAVMQDKKIRDFTTHIRVETNSDYFF